MENEILKEILSNIKNITTKLASIEEQQSYLSKQFDTSHDEQIAVRNEFNTFRDEQVAFRNEFNTFRREVTKQLTDLRTDVDTIYTLELDSRKTLKENTDILHEHSNILNELIKFAKVNQEQHVDFDKRISFLEAIVS